VEFINNEVEWEFDAMRYTVIYDKSECEYRIERSNNTLELANTRLPEKYDSYVHACKVCEKLNREDLEGA